MQRDGKSVTWFSGNVEAIFGKWELLSLQYAFIQSKKTREIKEFLA